MGQYVRDNEPTAALRRVYLLIFADTAGAAWAGSVTGLKAQLSLNGAAEVASVNDIVRVGGALHYIELTQAEANRTPADTLMIRVAAAAGRLEAFARAEIGADDLTVPSPTEGSIAAAVAAPSAATIAAAVAAPSAAVIATQVDTTLASRFTAIPTNVWTASTRELTAINATIRETIADTFLGRAIAGGSNAGRVVRDVFRVIRNRWVRSGATLTVYQEDDATVAYTASLTTDSGAAPITSVDPA